MVVCPVALDTVCGYCTCKWPVVPFLRRRFEACPQLVCSSGVTCPGLPPMPVPKPLLGATRARSLASVCRPQGPFVPVHPVLPVPAWWPRRCHLPMPGSRVPSPVIPSKGPDLGVGSRPGSPGTAGATAPQEGQLRGRDRETASGTPLVPLQPHLQGASPAPAPALLAGPPAAVFSRRILHVAGVCSWQRSPSWSWRLAADLCPCWPRNPRRAETSLAGAEACTVEHPGSRAGGSHGEAATVSKWESRTAHGPAARRSADGGGSTLGEVGDREVPRGWDSVHAHGDSWILIYLQLPQAHRTPLQRLPSLERTWQVPQAFQSREPERRPPRVPWMMSRGTRPHGSIDPVPRGQPRLSLQPSPAPAGSPVFWAAPGPTLSEGRLGPAGSRSAWAPCRADVDPGFEEAEGRRTFFNKMDLKLGSGSKRPG